MGFWVSEIQKSRNEISREPYARAHMEKSVMVLSYQSLSESATRCKRGTIRRVFCTAHSSLLGTGRERERKVAQLAEKIEEVGRRKTTALIVKRVTISEKYAYETLKCGEKTNRNL